MTVHQTYDPSPVEIEWLVHRWLHLAAIKGTVPSGFGDCWELVGTEPFTPWPEWAQAAMEAGAHPRDWCPVVNPNLLARASL